MQRYFALVLLSLGVVLPSPAKRKPQNVRLWMLPVEGCTASFYARQEPDPFFTNIVEFKDKGVVKFRGATGILENYRATIRLHIEYRTDLSILKTSTKPQKPCPPFDPGLVNFRAAWSNGSRTLPADTTVTKREHVGPEPLCEMTCSDLWVYKVQIVSRGVSLTDELAITIDSSDGRHLSTLAGRLGRLGHARAHNSVTSM